MRYATVKIMRKIVKLKEPLLDRLNLAEYANLLGRIHALTLEEGSEALGVELEAVEHLARSLEKLLDAVGRNLAAPETDELERLRLRRVKLGQYIIKAVRAAQEFPHEEIACAGRALYPVLKPCVGFYRLPAVQVTVIIEAMLLDLGKEENAGHVKTLGLDAHVAELADVNARYSSLVASRTQTRAAAVPVTVRKLRDESDALYRYITTLAFCHSVCHPSEATARYIGRLNAIIDETKTAYRQRRAKSKPQ